MEITEKWLGETGGWAAMKAARSLVDSGLASAGQVETGLVRGTAGGGRMKFAAGLRIRSRTDVDNLCTCPAARRGMICEHSLAVALASIKSATIPAAVTSPAPIAKAGPPAPPKPVQARGRYTVFLPESFDSGRLRDPVPVFIKFESGGEGEESLLAAWLGRNHVAERSTPLSLPLKALGGFLDHLRGHPRVLMGRPAGDAARSLAVAEQALRPPVDVAAAGSDEVRLSLSTQALAFVHADPSAWWLCRETQALFPQTACGEAWARLSQELARGEVRRPLRWLVENREALSEVFDARLVGDALRHFHVLPVPCRFVVELDGSLQTLEARLRAEFDRHEWMVPPPGGTALTGKVDFPFQDAADASLFYVRNLAEENRMAALLEQLGFTAETHGWRLNGAERVLAFFASGLPRLERIADVRESDRWRAATRGVTRIVPKVKMAEPTVEATGAADGGWLVMEFDYTAPDGYRLPRAEVLRMVRSGQKSVTGKNGRRYVLDAAAVETFEETLRDVPLQLTPAGARISALHASYFSSGEDASIGLHDLRDAAELAPLLGPLAECLRPYQMLGVRWIDALVRKRRGGVLGDDMGLGKTVQSIAAVLCSREDEGPAKPVLVVCPKSLVGNWQAEFARFAPALNVLRLVGSDRAKLFAQMPTSDVILTTYQLVARDQHVLQKLALRLLILDEASFIRNPETEAARAVCTLVADARLALTGTPVENSVRDLWSIYQFALPGYLGGRENFNERFEQPIASGLELPAARDASARLKRLLRPWFLRRTKREVLRDLPEKIEQVLWCDPGSVQAEVYRRILEEGREEIKAARKRTGQGGARMTMFTVLLRLRQACCDVRLTGIPDESLKGVDADDLSGKWSLWQERLEQVMQGGGKLLVFSQFVRYLHLLRARLEQSGIRHCYLDGASQDRDAQVREFQSNPDCPVFLISLKAGGYGLNLTAADHVFLMDPWWNPAVESQAIDRAHRIGQQRVVTALRFAMRGTVEERILRLQEKKRGLVEAALDEQSPLMAGLKDGDLEELLDEA